MYFDVFGNKISKSQYREMVNAQRNRRELRKAGLMNRRDLMKMGLLTSMGTLIPKRGLSSFMIQSATPSYGGGGGGGGSCPQQPASPATTPFVQPLNIMPQKKTTSISSLTVGGTPSIVPNNAAGEGRLCQHQSPIGSNSNLPFPPPNIYEIWQQPGTAVISPTYGNTSIWGFSEPNGQAISPGPTYVANYGSASLVRNVNKIPASAIDGYGINQVSTHLHNAHNPSESDGNPCDYFPNPSISSIANATYYDQYYPNVLAGFLSTNQPTGDVDESLSTLWYHDHRVGYTAPNVYHGLAGFYMLFSSNPNEYDTGNELTGFHLPTYPTYDIPMLFADRVFDSTGQLFFDEFNFDGILGDQFLVNGNIQPYLVVSPRRYRFRWLNTGPSRFYQIYLTNLNNLSATNMFWQISNGGNLLPNPVQVPAVMIGVSNRHDVIIDFSQYAGETLYLENRLQQVNGRGPTGNVLAAGTGNLLLKIQVTGPTVQDNSVNPATNPSFFALPSTNVQPLVQREFKFDLTNNGEWVINGQLMAACPTVAVCGGTDNPAIRFQVTQNSVETWEIKVMGGGQPPWTHPIHIHLEEFQILKNPPPSLFAANCNGQNNYNHNNYNDQCSGDTFCGDYSGRNQGQGPTGVENGRNDVLEAVPGTDSTLFFRFRDWLGKYPMHCHNVVHEDHAMMLLWEVAVKGDNNQQP
jgi:FtsP/CotA-like multicopper oxidase with cupredoxin domain